MRLMWKSSPGHWIWRVHSKLALHLNVSRSMPVFHKNLPAVWPDCRTRLFYYCQPVSHHYAKMHRVWIYRRAEWGVIYGRNIDFTLDRRGYV